MHEGLSNKPINDSEEPIDIVTFNESHDEKLGKVVENIGLLTEKLTSIKTSLLDIVLKREVKGCGLLLEDFKDRVIDTKNAEIPVDELYNLFIRPHLGFKDKIFGYFNVINTHYGNKFSKEELEEVNDILDNIKRELSSISNTN